MVKKRALITGVTGQDGSYLAELLLEKEYEVFGLVRRVSGEPFGRIEELITPPPQVKLLWGNLRDIATIERALEEAKPDEVYNLAAQSDVAISFKCPEETFEVDYYGVGRVVNAAMKQNPAVRIYQASSSEMFGASPPPQSEETPFHPVSPYAEAKLKSHQDFVEGYRARHGLFICSGILFNHESPRRGKNFVTRKTTLGLSRVKLGLQDHLELGNLEARRDWGFAGDYVKAMWMMLQRDKPEDFVIASWKSHSVRDFVSAAAKALDIPLVWEGKGIEEVGKNSKTGKIIIKVNPEFYRPSEVNFLQGDSSKAQKMLGWKPETSFEDLVSMMAKADLKEAERSL